MKEMKKKMKSLVGVIQLRKKQGRNKGEKERIAYLVHGRNREERIKKR